jgi:hypothetical protein
LEAAQIGTAFLPWATVCENHGARLQLQGQNILLYYLLLFVYLFNIEILERFQLRMIADAPWYVPNTVIQSDLQTPTVTEEIRRYSSQYSARLSAHPNGLVVNLIELPDNRRLRRHLPNDLPTRFLVELSYL